MRELFANFLGLTTGFGLLYIGLFGVLGCLLAAILSVFVWSSRGAWVKAIPGAFVVFIVPLMVMARLPGAENLAVPLALLAAVLTFVTHLRHWQRGQHSSADPALTLLSGASLAAILVPWIIGSVAAPAG